MKYRELNDPPKTVYRSTDTCKHGYCGADMRGEK